MPRLVRHEAQGPYQIRKAELDKEAVWICGCGLSGKLPFCDGTHKKTRDEEPDALYIYDEDDRVRLH